MERIKLTYQFENKTIIEFILEGHQMRTTWSCPTTRENLEPLLDEYLNKCIPTVYQKIADLTGRPITWVDKQGITTPRVYRPTPKEINIK